MCTMNNFHQIDLKDFIQINSNKSSSQVNLIQSKNKKLNKISKDDIIKVMEFHYRLNHISPTNMIIVMRNSVWNDVFIEPKIIEKVFSRQHCVY